MHPEYAANAPLRGSKWHLYEGGIRVPMIVCWPGRVEAGGTSDAVVLGTDLFATMAELAGVPSPAPDGLDSNSFASSLRGELLERTRPAVWHFPYYHPEKVLYFHEDERVALYDLASDIGEWHNLAPQRPRLTRELRAKLLADLERVEARFPERLQGTPS